MSERLFSRIMSYILRFLVLAIVAALTIIVVFYFRQDSMKYRPRAYREDQIALAPPHVVKLQYNTSAGSQLSWYVPPRNAADPKALPPRIWIMFGGNGSLALFWSDTVKSAPDGDAGYLMFDYPGYGKCEGKPSPKSMAESGDALLVALAKYLNVSPQQVEDQKLRLIGHSLGTGVALEFAVRHPVDRIVLAAPYTSYRDMANMVVTPWLSWLLTDNIDNMKNLAALDSENHHPKIIILHGDQDHVVPPWMSRKMKKSFPELIQYIEIPGGNHVSILNGIEKYMGNTGEVEVMENHPEYSPAP